MPRWAQFVVDLWLTQRRRAGIGPMGARGEAPLPCAGAWIDQPAALMDAFLLLDGMLEEGREEAQA
ncbi:MAG: hypothetical protein V4461_11045 [Pseudomonadota bacterium]